MAGISAKPGRRLLLALLVTGTALPSLGTAQAATPTPGAEPVPAGECRIPERERRVDVVARDGEAPPSLFPAGQNRVALDADAEGLNAVARPAPPVLPADLPLGPSVDAKTRRLLTATLRQLAACSNIPPQEGANRVLALYSDDYFRRNAAVTVQEVPAEDVGDLLLQLSGLGVARMVGVSYQVLPIGPEAAAPPIEETRQLGDGRVLALVRADRGGPLAVVFARDPTTGRYLIDEFAQLDEPAGTPEPPSG